MPIKQFEFIIQSSSTGKTESILVEAHTFPQASTEAYVACNNRREGSETWSIVSAVDKRYQNKD